MVLVLEETFRVSVQSKREGGEGVLLGLDVHRAHDVLIILGYYCGIEGVESMDLPFCELQVSRGDLLWILISTTLGGFCIIYIVIHRLNSLCIARATILLGRG